VVTQIAANLLEVCEERPGPPFEQLVKLPIRLKQHTAQPVRLVRGAGVVKQADQLGPVKFWPSTAGIDDSAHG
jgi:hypothetical protein